MFGEGRLLLDHPDFVADTWLNLASATWFYTTPQPPKPSMLHVIDGTWQPNEQVSLLSPVQQRSVTNANWSFYQMLVARQGGITCLFNNLSIWLLHYHVGTISNDEKQHFYHGCCSKRSCD